MLCPALVYFLKRPDRGKTLLFPNGRIHIREEMLSPLNKHTDDTFADLKLIFQNHFIYVVLDVQVNDGVKQHVQLSSCDDCVYKVIPGGMLSTKCQLL